MESIDTTVFKEHTMDMWEMHTLIVRPKDAGFSKNSRTRVIHLFFLKGVIEIIGSISATYAAMADACASIDVDMKDLWWDNVESSLRHEMVPL